VASSFLSSFSQRSPARLSLAWHAAGHGTPRAVEHLLQLLPLLLSVCQLFVIAGRQAGSLSSKGQRSKATERIRSQRGSYTPFGGVRHGSR
jgi:hypothetical protein